MLTAGNRGRVKSGHCLTAVLSMRTILAFEVASKIKTIVSSPRSKLYRRDYCLKNARKIQNENC